MSVKTFDRRTAPQFHDVAEGDREQLVEYALDILRAEYNDAVRSFARALARRVSRGELGDPATDAAGLRDAIDQAIDGEVARSEWQMYDHLARRVLLISVNSEVGIEDGYVTPEQLVEGGSLQVHLLAGAAFRADLVRMLEAFGVDLDALEALDLADLRAALARPE